jgi:hypothetical protein
MAVIVFYGAVLMDVLWKFIYAGFHTILNGKNFDKNMVYKKIQLVTIFLQHFAAVHAQFVKKLVFSNDKV